MNQKMKGILGTILSLTLLLTGCSAPAVNEDSSKDKLNSRYHHHAG